MTEKKENKEEWSKVESEIMQFQKEGDCIEGILIDKEKSKTYNNMVYKVKKDDGKTTVVFGTTVLDSQMTEIDIGKRVKIVFLGEKENEKKGQNPIKLFEVFFKD